MKLDSAAMTSTGRRSSNEDSLCSEPDLGFFAVADGMGGYEGGEVASKITIGTLRRFVDRVVSGEDVFLPSAPDLTVTPSENLLRLATMIAHQRIGFARIGPLAQMGSTVAMLWVIDASSVIAHVGDSRVYRLRGGKLDRLTRDHSLYEELLASGADVGPREHFPHAHVITRALGINDGSSVPDVRVEEIAVGDTFLLCTDGLSEVMPEERILELMAAESLGPACRALIDEAYRRGSRDNITAVLVRRVS